ncbi:MAG TPA: cytochrome C oxidase subunit II [Verrucomicrobiales bacterium]|nr:cytochrome C oxidase subunit II [Verrucomicrobiales bacterium]HIL69560.1 cytochrome C oxidase subunit II [Verrucomicrobiota bacterium]
MNPEPDRADALSKATFIITLITCVILILAVFFFILPAKGFWMIDNYLPRVSTFAGDIDRLCNLITFLVGFWFVISEAVLFYFIFKFRKKPGVKAQYLSGEKKEHKRWISIPHFLIIICDVVLIAGTIIVWANIKQRLPEAQETIRVTGAQWAWIFQHPGPDGILDSDDDITLIDELHIKKGTVYHFELQSNDVLHGFSIPVFRLKQDAVPGRVITGWFEATKTGSYDIQCAEMCGIGHGLMVARLTIEEPDQHVRWMESLNSTMMADAQSDAGGGDFE